MNKQSLEIITSIAAVAILITAIIVSHQLFINNPIMESYAFIASLIIFVVVISIIGIKLINME